MKQYKPWLTLIGFLLAGSGLFSLVLLMIGIQLSFLSWIDIPGKLFGFLFRLLMILFGFILVYVNNTNFDGKTP